MAKIKSKIQVVQSHAYVRLAFFSSLAAVAAYLTGVIAPNVSSVVAAITALLATRSAFHESAQEAGRQIAGTIAGAIIGGILLALFGFNLLVLLSSLAIAYGIGRLLRLGEEGAITISVTVILVLGLHLDGDAVESRVLGVIAGAVIGLVISLFIPYENPQDAALKKAVDYSHQISLLLSNISGAFRKRSAGLRIPISLAQEWLASAEEIRTGLEALTREAEAIVAGAKWSPLLERNKAAEVLEQCKIGTELSITVEGMCRELMVSDGTQSLSDTVALHLAEMFDAAADVVRVQADGAQHNPAQSVSPGSHSVQHLANAHSASRNSVKNLDETAALVLGGSLVQDGDTIRKILTEEPEKQ